MKKIIKKVLFLDNLFKKRHKVVTKNTIGYNTVYCVTYYGAKFEKFMTYWLDNKNVKIEKI